MSSPAEPDLLKSGGAAVEVRDRRLLELVTETAGLERLAGGFMFTEGPLWDARRGCLLFTDIPGNRIVQWRAADGATTWRQPSQMANGLAWDRQGRLLACEHATSRLTRTEHDGSITVLASQHGGQALNSPNDVVVKSDDAIYFSDPTYGRLEHYGVKRAPELAFRGVYRIDGRDGSLALLADDFAQPNGLCFSADERSLFVNDTERGHIRRFDVLADGRLQGGAVWAEVRGDGPGAPDGMKFDSLGNLYCCGPGGIHVFDAQASCLGVIRTPELAANFNWGGLDLTTLFVTASSGLYGMRVKVPGRPGGASIR